MDLVQTSMDPSPPPPKVWTTIKNFSDFSPLTKIAIM